MVLKKITSKIICQLIRSAATRTLFLGGKICFWETKIFGLVYFSPSSLLIPPKKIISPNCSIYRLVFCRFPKKSHPLETAARERGVWVDMLDILGGQNFCLGGTAPFCSSVVASLLIRICPEHDNISGRNRISTVLQCLTILLSHAKCFVSILLQSVVLNLLWNRICLASELNLSNQLE